jgi:hypothetical protein
MYFCYFPFMNRWYINSYDIYLIWIIEQVTTGWRKERVVVEMTFYVSARGGLTWEKDVVACLGTLKDCLDWNS